MKSALVAAAFSVAMTVGCTAKSPDSTGHPTRPIDLELTSVTGQHRRIADFSGQVRVVNLWATWCPPCMHELAMLERVSKDSGVVIIGVNQGEDLKRVRQVVRSAGVTYPVFLDPEQAFGAEYATIGLPTTLVMTRTNRVRVLHQGEYEEAELRADIAKAKQ